jgi:hypothetical protein
MLLQVGGLPMLASAGSATAISLMTKMSPCNDR